MARPWGGEAWVEAVRAQAEAEAMFDWHWQPAEPAELQVSALRDGDVVGSWEPVIELTGPYRLVAHLESVYLGVLARRTLVASNVRRVVDAVSKPVLFFADRFDHSGDPGRRRLRRLRRRRPGWPPTPRRPGGASAASAPSPTPRSPPSAQTPWSAVGAFARQFPAIPLIALVDFDNDSVATALACAREAGSGCCGVRLDT